MSAPILIVDQNPPAPKRQLVIAMLVMRQRRTQELAQHPLQLQSCLLLRRSLNAV